MTCRKGGFPIFSPVFLPADILLPKREIDLRRWAVLACDQFTSEPAYWEEADALAGGAPSALRMILPEVYLSGKDMPARVAAIHAAMARYARTVFAPPLHGFVYVERQLPGGVRQGLVGCVDLDAYDYKPGAQARIRPSEHTIEERIPPRLAVRREGMLESPHILMLIDDEAASVIEPLAQKKETLPLLYQFPLMLGGGEVRGWAVTEAAETARIAAALAALEDDGAFYARYAGAAGKTSPFALAVGDGNHSLATAKAAWEEIKPRLSAAGRRAHPARYCLVELENIRCPAIEIEPIHRVAFGAGGEEVLQAAARYAALHGAAMPAAGGQQQFTLLYAGRRVPLHYSGVPHPLATGTADAVLALCAQAHPGLRVDYVHGEDAVARLAARQGAVGLLMPPFDKGDLFRGVALGGVLPQKTFSMGHAREKRYYLECRALG